MRAVETLTAIGSFIRSGVETAIKAVIFALPVSWVATWCGVPPTWQSVAFMAFCIFWSGVVFAKRQEEANPDARGATETPKRTVPMLTRAEVATEARKLTHGPDAGIPR